MTARQQSLSAKVPRYAALFFPKDKTTAIVPTDNIQTETFKDKDVITVNFNDENLSAEIILMSNSRATLTDALEEFVPSTSETTEIQEADLNSNKKSKKALKKKTAKPACETVTSGSADEGPVTTHVPDATYDIDPSITEIVSLSEKNVCVRHTQTSVTEMVNNTTQTEPDCRQELFEMLLKKIEDLEKKIDIAGMEQRLNARIDSLEDKLNPNEPVSDVFTFCDEAPVTPRRNTHVSRPSTPLSTKSKCEITDIGFWKLTPAEVLGRDSESVKECASKRSVLYNPTFDGSLIESVKCESLNQRTLFAKNLMHSALMIDELFNKNINGKVTNGTNKAKINPAKITKIRTEVFKYFPCLASEEKKCWSECVKTMDKANLYFFSVVDKKYDISQIKSYVML